MNRNIWDAKIPSPHLISCHLLPFHTDQYWGKTWKENSVNISSRLNCAFFFLSSFFRLEMQRLEDYFGYGVRNQKRESSGLIPKWDKQESQGQSIISCDLWGQKKNNHFYLSLLIVCVPTTLVFYFMYFYLMQ